MQTPRADVAVLGPMVVRVGDDVVDITRPQVRHLLAMLVAVDDGWVSTDVLIENLWPRTPPKSTKSTLQLIVKRLRDALRDTDHELVVHERGGYRLDRGLVTSDIRRWYSGLAGEVEVATTSTLRSMEAIRRLWRGVAFAGVPDSEVLDVARRSLDVARIDAEVHEAAMLAGLGRAGLAARILEMANDRDPMREDVAVARVDCLIAIGRRQEALGVASATRSRFREQLGISPSRHLVDAEQRALRAGPGPTGESAASNQSSRRHGSATVWRKEPVRRTTEEIAVAVRASRSACIRIVAPPRMGRTAFLRDVARACEEQGIETRHHRRQVGLTHSLRSLLDSEKLAAAADGRAEFNLVVDELEAGVGPAVLLIDDIEHLDRWSLGLLDHLAGASSDVILVLGLRTGFESGTDAQQDLLVELEPLTGPEIASILAGNLGPESVVAGLAERVHLWSGGQPSDVREALHILEEDVAAPLPARAASDARTLRARLDELDQTSREIVVAASVLGPETPVALLQAMMGGVDFDARMSELVADGLLSLTARGDALLVPAPIADDVSVGLGRPEVAERLMRAAAWLRDGGDGVALAAQLLARIPSLGEVVSPSVPIAEWLVEGADVLERDGHHHEAAELLDGAVASGSALHVPHLRYRCAVAREWSGDLAEAEAEAVYNDLVETEGSSPSPDFDLLAAASLAGSGHSGGSIGGQERRRRRLTVAHRHLPADHHQFDSVTIELAYERWAARQPLGAKTRTEISRIASSTDSPAWLLARRLQMALEETIRPASSEAAQRLATDALERVSARDVSAADHNDAVKCLIVAVSVLMSWGDISEAEDLIAEIEIIGKATGMPQARWQSMAMRAALLDCRGRSAEADAAANESPACGSVARRQRRNGDLLRSPLGSGVSRQRVKRCGRTNRSDS